MRFCSLLLSVCIIANLAFVVSEKDDVTEDCHVGETGEVTCTSRKDGTVSESQTLGDDDDEYENNEEMEDDDEFLELAKKGANVVGVQSECNDGHELCGFWAGSGECQKNPKYMLENCRKSCNTCPDAKVLRGQSPVQHAENQKLLKLVERYGEPQTVDDPNLSDLTYLVIRQTIDYFENFIHAADSTHTIPEDVIKECTNKHKLCAFWAAEGECDKNPSYMTTKCAPSCRTCANIDFNYRCPPRDPKAIPALRPGELNHMFERIVETAPGNQNDESRLASQQRKLDENGMPIYTVTVHSRPETKTIWSDTLTEFPANRERDLKEDPWVITFDNFLTDEECDYLIELGRKEKYERSRDVGSKLSDGSYDGKISSTRTSENAWCSEKTGCRNDAVAQRIMERIANITRIPQQNFEDFQMLKYEKGQFYRNHHDYIDHQRHRQPGPRILTFFLYLSDVEGGGTHLDKVKGGLTIKPKKGGALLWPSVTNFDPM